MPERRLICCIPARLESTRMSRKLLRADTGRTLLAETVLNACSMVASTRGRHWLFDEVVVLSDSQALLDSIPRLDFGGPSLGLRKLLSPPIVFSSGTERIADEYAADESLPLIVNIQADEPELRGEDIEKLIIAARSFPACDMSTLAAPLDPRHLATENVVKVIGQPVAGSFFAEDFVRVVYGETVAPRSGRYYTANAFHHLGVYAYTPAFLKWFEYLGKSPGEEGRRLEQMRAVDNGARVRVAIVPEAYPGIDTEEEYRAFVERRKRTRP